MTTYFTSWGFGGGVTLNVVVDGGVDAAVTVASADICSVAVYDERRGIVDDWEGCLVRLEAKMSVLDQFCSSS